MIERAPSFNYVDIINEHINPDHVHMLVSVLLHLAVSKVVIEKGGCHRKGKSGRKQRKKFQKLIKRYQGATSRQVSIMYIQNIRRTP